MCTHTSAFQFILWLVASLKVITPIATDVTLPWSVCLYVSMLSVTLVHPAKAVGRNEMPFDRYTCVVPSDSVLDWSPTGREIWGLKPPVCSYLILLLLLHSNRGQSNFN